MDRGNFRRTTCVAFIIVGGALLTGATTAFGLSRLVSNETAADFWPWRAAPYLSVGNSELAKNNYLVAAAQARKALEVAPLSVRAYSLLGRISIAQGDIPAADAMMTAAARRSLRDAPSQTWIFARALERGEYSEAVDAFDILMRRRPDLADQFSPAVFAIADQSSSGRTALAQRLARSPPWRRSFMTAYIKASENSTAIYALLSELRASGSSPTDAEIIAYLNTLLQNEAYGAAYVAWSAHHSSVVTARDVGLVSDGGFEHSDLLPPFGWSLTTADGASAQVTSTTEGRGGQALRTSVSGGLTRQTLATQLLVLPSGTYRLMGRAWIESGDPDDRLAWRVYCEAGIHRDLASVHVPKGSPGQWLSFETTVQVPKECPAQRLRLEARPGESLSPVTVLFDDLSIVSVREVGADRSPASKSGAERKDG